MPLERGETTGLLFIGGVRFAGTGIDWLFLVADASVVLLLLFSSSGVALSSVEFFFGFLRIVL